MKLNVMMAGLLGSVALLTAGSFATKAALAVELHFVAGQTGADLQFDQQEFKKFAAQTGDTVTIVPMPSSTSDQFGQYKLWLAAGNTDIDVYQTDVVWAPQLADQFVDLTAAAGDVIKNEFPATVQSQTVNGKLVALPLFADAGVLYYRKDLLQKYNLSVPTSWDDLTTDAQKIQDGERAAGNKDMWGFVFQGNAYEGLTCDALEWIKSFGGGQIIDPSGDITVNNPKSVAALTMATKWVNTISPPGVLAYQEEEARGVWQTGNAAFMRNWPYAFALGNAADSPIKGKFDITALPAGPGGTPAATLGGWAVAVSKFSKNQAEATKLAVFMSSAEVQKDRAIALTELPTRPALYDDPDVAKAQPTIPKLKDAAANAVPRPSAPAKIKYNEVSNDFWNAVHDTLSGNGSAQDNMDALEAKLTDLKGSGW